MSVEQNEAAARRCVELFNQRSTEWLDKCYARQIEWIEMPTSMAPNGRGGDRAAFRSSAEQLLRVFPDRQMTISNLVAGGDQVVLELDWRGTAAVSAAGLTAGSVTRLHIVTFLTFANQLIIKHVDYCVPGRAS